MIVHITNNGSPEDDCYYVIIENALAQGIYQFTKVGTKGIGQVRLKIKVEPGEAKVDEERLRGIVQR